MWSVASSAMNDVMMLDSRLLRNRGFECCSVHLHLKPEEVSRGKKGVFEILAYFGGIGLGTIGAKAPRASSR